MILAKDDIEKAVSWWAGKLMDHQPHSNGDDSFTSVAVCFLADTMRQSVTLDQLNTFKAALAKSMAAISSGVWCAVAMACRVAGSSRAASLRMI